MAAPCAGIADEAGAAVVFVDALHTSTGRVAAKSWPTILQFRGGSALILARQRAAFRENVALLSWIAGKFWVVVHQHARGFFDAKKRLSVARLAHRAVRAKRTGTGGGHFTAQAERAKRTQRARSVRTALEAKTFAQFTDLRRENTFVGAARTLFIRFAFGLRYAQAVLAHLVG